MKIKNQIKIFEIFLMILTLFGASESFAATSGISAKYSGAVQFGYTNTTCNSTISGALRYNSSGGTWNYCNGSAWTNVTGSNSFCSNSTAWTKLTAAGARNWFGIATSSSGAVVAAIEYSGNIWVSTDSGATWTARGSAQLWDGVGVSVDGTIILAGTEYGHIWRSTNSGSTFTELTTGPTTAFTWKFSNSSSDGTKWLAVQDSSTAKLYLSTNSGSSWTAVGTAYQYTGANISSDGTKMVADVYAGYIYRSTDSGSTWAKLTGSASRHFQGIAGSSDGAKLIAPSGYGEKGQMSTDSGTTWVDMYETDTGSPAMSSDGSIVGYTDILGDVALSKDGGTTFSKQASPWNNGAGLAMSSDGSVKYKVDTNGSGYIYKQPTSCP